MTKLANFKCSNCDKVFEFLLHGDDPPECPYCGSLKVTESLSTPLVTKLHDPKALKESLERRSAEHTLSQVKKLAGHKGTLPKRFGRRGYRAGDH